MCENLNCTNEPSLCKDKSLYNIHDCIYGYVPYYCVNLCGICKTNVFNPTFAFDTKQTTLFKTLTEAEDLYTTLETDLNTIETSTINIRTTDIFEEISNTTQELDYESSGTEFTTTESRIFQPELLDSDTTLEDPTSCLVLNCKNAGINYDFK